MKNEMIQKKLLKFCENVFPTRKNIRATDIARISDGWENEVYSFIMEYEESRKKSLDSLILRIYQGDNTQNKAKREFYGMKRLRELGYPVPQVMALALEESPFGSPAVVMEKINGRLMGRVIDEAYNEKREELINIFCMMLVNLHSLDWKTFAKGQPSYDNLAPFTSTDPILEMVNRYIEVFQAYEYIPILKWLEDRKSEVSRERPSIIHLDYHPNNIILRDDEKAFVIDWTNIDIADFRIDLAWTILLTSTYGNPEARDIVFNRYQHIADREVKNFEYFEVITALRRLFSISVSITQGANKMGMRPQAVEMMKWDVKHIKNVYTFLLDRTGISIPKIEEMILDISRPEFEH